MTFDRKRGRLSLCALFLAAPVIAGVLLREGSPVSFMPDAGVAKAVTTAAESTAGRAADPESRPAGFQATAVAPSPITTAVLPDTSAAEPREIVLTPETGLAGPQSQVLSSDADDGGPPLTAIGIAAGAGAAGIVLAVGVFIRAVRARPRAD